MRAVRSSKLIVTGSEPKHRKFFKISCAILTALNSRRLPSRCRSANEGMIVFVSCSPRRSGGAVQPTVEEGGHCQQVQRVLLSHVPGYLRGVSGWISEGILEHD